MLGGTTASTVGAITTKIVEVTGRHQQQLSLILKFKYEPSTAKTATDDDIEEITSIAINEHSSERKYHKYYNGI